MELEIENAGLVLLFPFLERYLEACGLIENGLFTSERSVISHWKVLNGSSIESLQILFLQRWGLLVVEKNEINLQIENRAFDNLLEHLPWTYSLFKFPWIDPLFKTDW
jgi:hypothetical protein